MYSIALIDLSFFSCFTFSVSCSAVLNSYVVIDVCFGRDVVFRVAFVIMHSMPSVPANSRMSFVLIMLPLPVTSSSSSVQFAVLPYFIARVPAASVANMPPIVATVSLEGMTGKYLFFWAR